MINPTTTATMRIPTHTPALKISPIASQPESVTKEKISIKESECFILIVLIVKKSIYDELTGSKENSLPYLLLSMAAIQDNSCFKI